MANRTFARKEKGDLPVLAICYDFDKTLSPDDMQAQGYIQSVGYDVADFWSETNTLADTNDMDQNLAYMFKMVTEAEGNIVFNKKALEEYKADNSNTLSWIEDKGLNEDYFLDNSTDKLYSDFTDWCKLSGIKTANVTGKKTFYKEVITKYDFEDKPKQKADGKRYFILKI